MAGDSPKDLAARLRTWARESSTPGSATIRLAFAAAYAIENLLARIDGIEQDPDRADGGPDDDVWVWPASMPEWLRELATAHDVQLFQQGRLHGSPVYICNGECCCVFIIDDGTFLDRYSLVGSDGGWCPGNDCPCHAMPTGEVGTR